MKLKLLFAAAVAFAAFPAQAQDNDNFTGPRIQAQAGWDRTGIAILDPRNFGGRGNFGLGDQDNEVGFGGEVGFDVDVGGFVIGAYVGANFSSAAEGFDFDATGNPRILLEAERDLYAGARAGVTVAPRVLIYGKGGFSRGTLDATITGTPTIPYPVNEDEFDGFHFGGGVEMRLGRMFYIRADYTHTTYDDLPINATNELHFNRNTVMGAIGVRF